MNAFDVTDLRNMVYFLGMEILHSEKGIILHQLKYELELMNCKPTITHAETNHKLDSDDDGEDVDTRTFKQLVSCMRYMCNTRPDICYVVGTVSRFMSKPKWSHYRVIVRILRYVKGTLRH